MYYYILENIYVKVFHHYRATQQLISSPEKKKNRVLLLTRKISVQNVGNPTLDSLFITFQV